MACKGCGSGAKFSKDPGITDPNPVIDPIDFESDDGYSSDGACAGDPCAQAAPCAPKGGITFSNCWPKKVQVNYRTFPGGYIDHWQDVNSGTSAVIRMDGTKTVDCGDNFLMGFVWCDGALLGQIDF